MSTSAEITHWLHTVNECNFTPAEFTEQVIILFKNSLRLYRLNLDVQDHVFNKCICDAVCTFYYSRQRHRTIQGPLRNFTTPSEWTTLCEDCWQELLIFRFFSLEYWDNFWESIGVGELNGIFLEIQPFLTAVLPLYVRRSIKVLEQEQFITLEDGNFIRLENHISDDENDDYEYAKTKKQRKLLNDSSS